MEFMNLFNQYNITYQSLELDITWDKVADWCLLLYHSDSNTVISKLQESDYNRLMAQAYLDFTDWLVEKQCGY